MKTCCSVDWGRTIPGAGHLPSSLVPTTGHLAAKVSPPPGICHPREKNANARGLARGGAWAQLELTDALQQNKCCFYLYLEYLSTSPILCPIFINIWVFRKWNSVKFVLCFHCSTDWKIIKEFDFVVLFGFLN